MTNTCYYCGEPATSDEHAPPRCIFPRQKDTPERTDYRANLITVRSCDTHNSRKSTEDEYLLYVLVLSLPSNDVGKNLFLSKVLRAIERRPLLMDRLLINHQQVTLHDTINDEWNTSIALMPEERRLNSAFEGVARAIYFYETGTVWAGRAQVYVEFLISMHSVQQNQFRETFEKNLDEMLKNVPHKGENQDVFSYQFVVLEDKILLRMHFYGNSKVTVIRA